MLLRHLEELKRRVYHLLFCWFGLIVLGSVCFLELCIVLLTPFDNVCCLELTEAFSVSVKVLLFYCLLFVAPAGCFQFWCFVCGGLTIKERVAWGWSLASIAVSLLFAVIFSQLICQVLCVWFLGYSRRDVLVLQYLPKISEFVWFKLKCFVAVWLQAFITTWYLPRAVTNKKRQRRWLYTFAFLYGAVFAAGTPQLVLSFCLILLFEVLFCFYYIKPYLAYPLLYSNASS